jgi:hypothetical protein
MEKESKDEIEITPEMIEAGRNILYTISTSFADEEYWAEQVFRAMIRAAPSRIASDTLREAGLP